MAEARGERPRRVPLARAESGIVDDDNEVRARFRGALLEFENVTYHTHEQRFLLLDAPTD